jgi:predicted RNase H-like HicB family nuclease
MRKAREPGGVPSSGASSWLPLAPVSEELHLTIRYSDAGAGWVTAQVAEIPGAISQGKTREEARANVLDALDVLLTPDEQLVGGARPWSQQRIAHAHRDAVRRATSSAIRATVASSMCRRPDLLTSGSRCTNSPFA